MLLYCSRIEASFLSLNSLYCASFATLSWVRNFKYANGLIVVNYSNSILFSCICSLGMKADHLHYHKVQLNCSWSLLTFRIIDSIIQLLYYCFSYSIVIPAWKLKGIFFQIMLYLSFILNLMSYRAHSCFKSNPFR